MKKVFLFFATVIVFVSCEKVLFEPDLASHDPMVNFDYLWNEVDKKYSYFELKNMDWNEVRTVYRPMLTASSTEEELFDVLGMMLNELRDDHTALFSPFNVSRYTIRLTGPENYHQRTIEEFYMPDAWQTGAFSHGFLENEEIGYIRYGSFLTEFSDEQLDLILNRYQHTRGLILDLRANGGGVIFNVPKILARFTEAKTLVGYYITRNGPMHTDFSERENFYITPYEGVRYSGPLIVLIDKGSYSATTLFALATKAFPNITLMGDTTGGGGGKANGGQLPNGWTYQFSVSQLLDLNGSNYAEDGVPADVPATFDWSDITKDEILEAAISRLNPGASSAKGHFYSDSDAGESD